MGFEPPKVLQDYLNLEWRTPPQNFVNCSLYYAGLDPYFIDYMNRVIRPCLAYCSGTADNTYNSGIKMNVGYALKNTAVKLVKGDKIIYDGDDLACKQISDVWAPFVNFESFLESAFDYLLSGGTTAVKLNIDRFGRCIPSALRVDRYYATTDDIGNVINIIIFNAFLFTEKYGSEERQYWLIEERYYNKKMLPCVIYKVHAKEGIAGKELLPIDAQGIDESGLPEQVLKIIRAKGIKLNKEVNLPFKDGLGVWIWRRTANNSCVPGLCMGDPILYGALDLIWAVDMVFSGSITDVLLGKGKILVPKKYLESIREDLKAAGIKDVSAKLLSATDKWNDSDDSFVYIYTEYDKNFTPQSVQFDIRTEKYSGMLDVYLRHIITHCGFAPTSIMPFLQTGNWGKTATEVTSEGNLTQETVQSLHKAIIPYIERIISEVLYQSNIPGKVNIKLSDYVGNKLIRDENIRNNFKAGLIPEDVAIQQVNTISASETEEYIQKIKLNRFEKQQEAIKNSEEYNNVSNKVPFKV